MVNCYSKKLIYRGVRIAHRAESWRRVNNVGRDPVNAKTLGIVVDLEILSSGFKYDEQ
ncbi:hypothetical protein GCM10027217_28850 [Pseudomaricurvus hydrocarbonicus]